MKVNRPLSHLAPMIAMAFVLQGCGEPSAEHVQEAKVNQIEGLRTSYQSLSDARLLEESLRLLDVCSKEPSDPNAAETNCSEKKALVEDLMGARGYCWGPYAAAQADKSWMACSDDVTKLAMSRGPWYASTPAGVCRETAMGEAIGSVLEHQGQWNVKTSFSPQGFLDVSSQLADGSFSSVRLYPTCAGALMTFMRVPEARDGRYLAAPLGIFPREAGEYFGFDASRSCGGYSYGGGLGCTIGYQDRMPALIELSDGFAPCTEGRPVQLDFQPQRGMVGLTCSVSSEKLEAFHQKMREAFGPGELSKDGARRWKLGKHLVRTMEGTVLGNAVRRVSVSVD